MKRILGWDIKSVTFVMSLTSIGLIIYLLSIDNFAWEGNSGLIFTLISLIFTSISLGISIFKERKSSGT